MHRIILGTAISLLLASGLTWAGDPKTRSAAASKQKAERDVICRTVREVGSRIPKRVCTTRAQREAMRNDSQGALRKIQTQTTKTGGVEG